MFPYRLHIAILILAAVVWGLLSRRRPAIFLATCVALFLLFFWLVTPNKSPRYLTCIMPFVALFGLIGFTGYGIDGIDRSHRRNPSSL